MKMSKGKFWTIVTAISGAVLAIAVVVNWGNAFYAMVNAPKELPAIHQELDKLNRSQERLVQKVDDIYAEVFNRKFTIVNSTNPLARIQ